MHSIHVHTETKHFPIADSLRVLALQRNLLTYFQTVELASDLDELPCVVDVRFRFERARDLSIKDPATTFSHGTGYNYFRRVADRGRGRIEADLALTNQPSPSPSPCNLSTTRKTMQTSMHNLTGEQPSIQVCSRL